MSVRYKGIEIDSCANPTQMKKKDVEEIIGNLTGSLVGFKCKKCGAWWKIYQNECHSPDCEYKTRDGV